MRKSKEAFFAVAIALTWLAGVASVSAQSYDYGQYTPSRPIAALTTCAGIRGNGQNLFAHYGSLARHVEEYGAIKCAAGGSSGSITAFFIESIWASPDVHNCRRGRCGIRARDARMSLMLKSVVGLVDTGLFEDATTINALIGGIQAGGIVELLEGPTPQEGVDALLRLLRDLGPLINPELFVLFEILPTQCSMRRTSSKACRRGSSSSSMTPRCSCEHR